MFVIIFTIKPRRSKMNNKVCWRELNNKYYSYWMKTLSFFLCYGTAACLWYITIIITSEEEKKLVKFMLLVHLIWNNIKMHVWVYCFVDRWSSHFYRTYQLCNAFILTNIHSTGSFAFFLRSSTQQKNAFGNRKLL